MKPTELRIGNLVKISELLRNELFNIDEVMTNTDTFPVAMIDTMFINLYINEEEHEFDLKDINPIPLTEQWLKDFGFTSEYEMLFKKDKLLVGTWNMSAVNPNVKLDYVHQLQNLYFALTGKELTKTSK